MVTATVFPKATTLELKTRSAYRTKAGSIIWIMEIKGSTVTAVILDNTGGTLFTGSFVEYYKTDIAEEFKGEVSLKFS